jgi:hypothetical protein
MGCDATSRQVPIKPWFLSRKPLVQGQGRLQKVSKAPERLTYDVLVGTASDVNEAYELFNSSISNDCIKRFRSYRPTYGAHRVQLAKTETSREKYDSAYNLSE